MVGLETTGTGITAVRPGWVETAMVEKQIADIAIQKKIRQHDAAMGLLGQSSLADLRDAGAVAFLCWNEEASLP